MRDADGFQQPRTFAYDGRGFLLSETHPENGTTTYSDYDALGHARRKRTGPAQGAFDLAFAYDAAERLTEVKEWRSGGTGRVLKSFTYGTGTSAADRSNGKISTAVRHNYIVHPDNGNPLDVIVTETYTYGGSGGRASRRNTVLNTGQGFTQQWSWDALGNPATITYPTCTHAAACTSDPRQRTVGHQYQLGYLTAIPGWAGSIGYHPNGMLREVVHANGVVYGQGLDPHWMRRPGSLSATHPSGLLALAEGEAGPLATPLAFTYDGAGNVKSWAENEYRYDPVSRILEGRLGTNETQKYTYDLYGNLLSITTDRHQGPVTVVFGIDRTTNRLSAAAYDAAGNLTVRAPYSYSWDSFSMMKTMDGGGNRSTYVYTADDERIWSVDASVSPWRETFTLRDLDGKALRLFTTSTGAAALAWSQDYVHRDGQLLATARVSGASETRHHFHLDHLGTPLLVTNPQGGTEALHSYFPLGEELHPNVDSERMKFTGHERDLNRPGQADDLDYMHARYHSPMSGRFLSVDPIGGSPRMPQSWNRYSYVMSNPLKYRDPYGLRGESPQNPWSDEITVCEEAETGRPCKSRIRDQELNAHYQQFLAEVIAYRAEASQRDYHLLDVRRARAFYEQKSFDASSVAGIFFYETLLDIVPETQAGLAGELAMAVIPGPFDNAGYAALKGSRFFGKFANRGAFGHTTRELGQFTEFAVNVPGRVPGSYTRWVKVVNRDGRTVRVYHDTYDQAGRFVGRGVKVPGPERHVQ